jgi:hypothetical protein
MLLAPSSRVVRTAGRAFETVSASLPDPAAALAQLSRSALKIGARQQNQGPSLPAHAPRKSPGVEDRGRARDFGRLRSGVRGGRCPARWCGPAGCLPRAPAPAGRPLTRSPTMRRAVWSASLALSRTARPLGYPLGFLQSLPSRADWSASLTLSRRSRRRAPRTCAAAMRRAARPPSRSAPRRRRAPFTPDWHLTYT